MNTNMKTWTLINRNIQWFGQVQGTDIISTVRTSEFKFEGQTHIITLNKTV
jgi:hypothetical protein